MDSCLLSRSRKLGMTGRLHMTLIKYAAVVVAALALCAGAQAAVFVENFDSYVAGSQMHGQGGWAGWDNVAGAGALVSSAYSSSSPNSVDINGASDLVHTFSGITAGKWTISTNQYIPSSSAGTTWAVFLNQYNAGVSYDWSLDMGFDTGTNTVTTMEGTPTPRPLIKDQWVPIRIEVDWTTMCKMPTTTTSLS